MKIDKAIKVYIRSRSSQLADNTIRVYKGNLEEFNSWLGDTVLLSQITDEHVDEFLLFLKGKYSESTRQNYANTLRAFFKFWYGKRETSIAWELISGPRVPEKFPDFISPEQFALIDDCCDEDDYNQLTKKVIFHLLWNTGMRVSELLSLNLNDIDTRNNHVFIVTKKSKKLRMVMWNNYCHNLLLKYLGVRLSLNKSPELFHTPMGTRNRKRTRLTSRSIQRWCKELEQFLGFRIHPHAFRHGKCHEIINGGGNRHQVQAIAGHSSITSSEVYVRLNVKEQKELLTRFLPDSKNFNTIEREDSIIEHLLKFEQLKLAQ